jgi:hypothetical protein
MSGPEPSHGAALGFPVRGNPPVHTQHSHISHFHLATLRHGPGHTQLRDDTSHLPFCLTHWADREKERERESVCVCVTEFTHCGTECERGKNLRNKMVTQDRHPRSGQIPLRYLRRCRFQIFPPPASFSSQQQLHVAPRGVDGQDTVVQLSP